MAPNDHVLELLRELRAEQQEQGKNLHRIEIQTTKTNGHVAECFRQLEAHDIEFRDLKALVASKAPAAAAAVVPTIEPAKPGGGDADLVVRVPRALWAKALAAFGGLSIFAPLIYRWLEKFLGL